MKVGIFRGKEEKPISEISLSSIFKMKVAIFLITVRFFISFVPVAESQTNGADLQAMQALQEHQWCHSPQMDFSPEDNAGGIIVINFQKMGFGGTISPDIVLLTSLQKLLLADNNLTDSIPPEIAKLPNLLELDVRNNKISRKVPSFNGNVKVETDGNPDIGKDTGGSSGSPGTSPVGGRSSGGRGNANGSVQGVVRWCHGGSSWRGIHQGHQSHFLLAG